MKNILILCTGNSARSILGEALLNRKGESRIQAFSAGSIPKGAVNPGAVRLLSKESYDLSAFRSKSWDEFAQPEAPHMDMVITVCASAAGETCPIWPGAPIRAHWGLADPAYVTSSEAAADAAFAETYRLLGLRIDALLGLPFEDMNPQALQAALDEIGQGEGAV